MNKPTPRQFLFSADGKVFLNEEYAKKGCSTYQLAESLGTYPNLVRRALKHHHIPTRDHSKAQAIALATGRHHHPTKGTKRLETTKDKISGSVAESWSNIDEKERQRRSDLAKAQWHDMGAGKREELRKLSGEAVRQAAVEGSRLEKFLVTELLAREYQVQWHRQFLTAVEKFHVDLYLPDHHIAIEVDGPSHYDPIWGEEALAYRQEADRRKTTLLNQADISVFRVVQRSKHLSRAILKKALTPFIDVLESMLDSPIVDNRSIEV